ncbi:MAG: putative lipid II flippase FtsW [Candidatus Dojkabacteria bacterium]
MFKRKRKPKTRKSPVAKREKVKRMLGGDDKKGLFWRLHKKPNYSLIALVAMFLLGGIIMNFSASNYYGHQNHSGDVFFYTTRHLLWIFIGILAAYILYLIPINWIKKFSPVVLGIGILLLIYIVPEALFGDTVILADGSTSTSGIQMPFVLALNGAPRWIDIGIFNMQPSEIVKFGFAIYIAAWLTKEKNMTARNANNLYDHIKNVIAPFMVLLGIVSGLILIQRDFDTTVVLALSILAIYFVSGTDRLHSIGTMVIIIIGAIFGSLALIFVDYRRERLETFFHLAVYGEPSSQESARDEAFQSFNSLVALGAGGITGVGYNESVIKQGYLQEAAYTDSILAIIAEEFGYIGTTLVIIGFIYFASIGYGIALKAKSKFSSLVAVGMTSLITIQAFLNIAAVLVVIPFGGMPLPFFTYGGTTTIISLACVGVLLNISKEN